MQAKAQQQRDATMAQHEHQRRVEISVTPRYLVPDTNCFIEHLHSIKRLLQAQKYMLIVPIIGTLYMLIVPIIGTLYIVPIMYMYLTETVTTFVELCDFVFTQ